jgi:hypothetical protein
MFCYVKDNFLYLNIPRNGSNTFGRFFEKNGWVKYNLFENEFDLTKMIIFGHLTDPIERHTKGLAMYIRINQLNIDNPVIAKILVSGVFDEHTCSISMMLGPLFNLPIHWIPLDITLLHNRKFYNGNNFTNEFFKQHNLKLEISDSDNKNTLVPEEKIIRDKIKSCKEIYNQNFQQIVKNFFEQDLILYAQVLKKYNENINHKFTTN